MDGKSIQCEQYLQIFCDSSSAVEAEADADERMVLLNMKLLF